MNIEDKDFENQKNHYEDNLVLFEATTSPTEECYYHCSLEIGPCTKPTLTNRTKNIILQLGVTLQDLRFKLNTRGILKLIRNSNGYLVYITEKLHNLQVKKIAKENKEVKLHGQGTKTKEDKVTDPREIKLNKQEEKPKVRKDIDPREVDVDDRKHNIPQDHTYEDHLFDKKGEKSKIADERGYEKHKAEYHKKMNREMYQHHDHFEHTEDWMANETNQEKPKFLEDNTEGYCSLGNFTLEQKANTFIRSDGQEKLPQTNQYRDTDSYPETEAEAEGMTQNRDRVIHNSRFHKKFQPQRTNKPGRSYTTENQSQQTFTRPPPNMEKTSIIEELNKVGFNQRSKINEENKEQEVIRDIRRKEQEFRRDLEAQNERKDEKLKR